MSRLPPLNALVAFRAVMETGSLVSAAQNLSITASAVSHRLKALEDHLGLELFERRSRAVFPTAAAYRYHAEISEAFDRIAAATRTIEAVGNRDTLSILCPSSFASNWLFNWLPSFSEEHEDVSVVVTSRSHDIDLKEAHSDLVVVRTQNKAEGFEELTLGREKFRPLIAPSLLEEKGYPKKLTDLLELPVIRSLHAPLNWDEWLQNAGVSSASVNEVMVFDDAALALKSAEKGFGIVLESNLLSGEAEAAGRLVPLFPEYQQDGAAHRLLWREKRGNEPKIRAFREWLEDQMHYGFVRRTEAKPAMELVG